MVSFFDIYTKASIVEAVRFSFLNTFQLKELGLPIKEIAVPLGTLVFLFVVIITLIPLLIIGNLIWTNLRLIERENTQQYQLVFGYSLIVSDIVGFAIVFFGAILGTNLKSVELFIALGWMMMLGSLIALGTTANLVSSIYLYIKLALKR
ncbi:MPN129 family protein [Mycoplasmoides pneumoniae]|uniref:Uncharacterized protein MPN_129 n=3 Tax=Mycoplasmoides pneumoniae TaxID=2104 RepID=Y129_MYCPN|nr:hypothetical protein [Mycoplasmoides pneumoniae]P75346.1 RecName: Full=Uncharacterized protein MPN_129 [Mycoplasmoides pneumoniae M129]AAB95673.1 adhesin P1 (group 2)-like protein [Mycoplasmoides pneumoniae M129]ACN39199.1 group 2 adhesin P1-like protein [Mycoplasmoides pneumoniae]AJR19025.1 hypothetical protein C985_00885 [Mycoplasmoides pneumoniae M129-B7]ALA30013.1 hypothetical protein C897_00765 [Mycoplasmoides pneumoniae PI 1428]ALA30976.1 hypothetical protein B434_02275 [Mycoplasmoid